jgi:predicted DCC family thiol-disulfide oxidoreductase YuxK|mmetsp:Transcript_66232/g.181595  ORF Transcript_66232/g.181595 Transcript_66232/m.181595 type:complete len:140 (+) Transcript_66232:98-517(+)
MDRDVDDHVRFCPLQSHLGQKLCTDHGAPIDVSTAVLLNDGTVHTESAAILTMFAWMGPVWAVLGFLALCVPAFLRNFAYRAFSRHRGTIWKGVKRITGWGDVCLEAYRDRILGLEDMPTPLPLSWGFGEACSGHEDKQ